MISIGGENLIDFVSGDPAANGLPQYVANPGGLLTMSLWRSVGRGTRLPI